MRCQTIETMFANKLVSVLDRFEKHHSIAGRDLYDIHQFFLQGFHMKRLLLKRALGFSKNFSAKPDRIHQKTY